MILFRVLGLKKKYGERVVLDLPSLSLEKGIIYGLQGPNGSGKTTLMEILSFLIPPTSGEIFYEDRKVDPYGGNLTSLRREVALVPQNPLLFTTTVYRNVELGLKIRKAPSGTRRKIIEECLDLVGMQGFASAEAHKLSGGETQRVAIARALACSPKVLFFDEPTSNVDTENQMAIEKIIRDINGEKRISVVFTSHNPGQASKLSHRMVALFEGKLVTSAFGNIFRGRITKKEGKKYCLIQERAELRVNSSAEGAVKLSIDPLKVLTLGKEEQGHSENVLTGEIVQLLDLGRQILLTLHVGFPLNVAIPKSDLLNRSYSLGESIKVYCPPEGIQIF
ncbi:MAG: ATP-binding cassette domain-containing protein [Desulfobacterales bacterium]|nr:ATP-binding cassette domain-containing protein [Desulfobacterales bacterium]